MQSKDLWNSVVAEQVGALYHMNDVLEDASLETCAEVEDEDNAEYHLCLLNRTTFEDDAISPYASLHTILVVEVVVLVTLEVSPS